MRSCFQFLSLVTSIFSLIGNVDLAVPGTHSRLRKRRSLLEADRFVAPTYKLRHKSFNAGDSGDSVVEESQLLSFEQYHTLLDMAAPDLERTKKVGLQRNCMDLFVEAA